MRLDHIFPRVNLALLEAKARIEHPEDMILDGGLRGAQTALRILQATALKPQSVSVKFDGSPALIMGWRGDDFVLTDKAGFGAKGYDGMTTSSDAVESMIMARKMKDTSEPAVAARRKYAQTIASLYPILRASVPKSFAGYAQGDLLWVGTPPVVDGAYQFKPNKVLYKVPVDSDLGKRIAGSKVGMVIHSVYPDQSAQEPDALRDVHELGFSEDHGLVIVPHEIELESTLSLDPKVYAQAQKILSAHGAHIDAFLDPLALADRNIKALPGFMKSFLAHKAGEGSNDFSRVGEEFLTWLTSAKSKASGKQQAAITDWIQQNLEGYNDVWHVVKLLVDLKLHLKAQMDQQVGDVVAAHLNDKPGHEGFVSVTPDGIIKLVHRAEFMRKDTSESLMEAQEPAPAVVFTFIRANPPTLGHQLVVDQVARHARGGDYWVFFSQSQDAKKNPLSWHDKVQFATKLMPRHKSHFARGAEFAHVKTPLLAMDWLYNQGYRNITMVVGSDRVDSMNDILNGWNSEAIRSKYGRDPVQVRVISAGERDPDAEGVTGISASMVRELAARGDRKAFDAAVGLDPTTADSLYDAVRKGMKIGEPKGKKKVQEAQTLEEAWPLLLGAAGRLLAAAAPKVLPNVGRALGAMARNPVKTTIGGTAAVNPQDTVDVVRGAASVAGGALDAARATGQAVRGAAQVAASTTNFIRDTGAAAAQAGQAAYTSVEAAAAGIAAMTKGMLGASAVQALAKFAVQYALPAAAVVALLYGGKKLYDYFSQNPPQELEKVAQQVNEGLWNKIWGKRKPKLARPSQFPPPPHTVENTTQWVKDWVAYERSEGRDPAHLFDPNQISGSIWLTIHAGWSEKLAKDTFKHLWNDPEIGPMIRNAPQAEPRGQIIAPSDTGYSSTGSYNYRDSLHDMGTVLTQLWEDRPADHRHGTIVMLRMSSASGDKLAEWCKQNNVPCMDPHNMHISVLFSKKPVPHLQVLNNTPIQVTCKPQAWKMLGDKALTLVFDCPAVQKIHQDLKDLGGEHSYPDLIVHTSVNYDWNHQLALPDQLPSMPLVFDRVEVMAIDPDYKPNSN